MQYTENYELPIIEGTDVPNYAPYNECANKVDDALGDMATDVAESVASVNVIKTELEQEMNDFSEEMQQTLDTTVQEINTNVNDRLSATPRYKLALGMDYPRGYRIGGQTGNDRIPISDFEFSKTYATVVNDDNSFSNQSVAPVPSVLAKISLDICVSNEEENGTIEIDLVRHDPTGNTTINSRVFSLVGGNNNVHLETITNINFSNSSKFYFVVSSNESKTLWGKNYLTVENIGL